MCRGCVVNQTGGIHDGESFANRWSHSKTEMRRTVGAGVVGVVLGECGIRAFLGLESVMKVRELQLQLCIWGSCEGEEPAGAGRKCRSFINLHIHRVAAVSIGEAKTTLLTSLTEAESATS